VDKGKDWIREKVWRKLIKVAKPDSRFHWNFAEFIPDFKGSERCADQIRSMDVYVNAEVVFITPDNCLQKLREYAIMDGKKIIMPTYGIKRGFLILHRGLVPEGKEDFASTLDGADIYGKPVTLLQLKNMGKVDLLVTGASAVNMKGVRYGKGHGYFDLEWAMLREIGVVGEETPIIAVIHDCQLVEESIEASPYDTIVDYIITPSRTIKVENRPPKPRGIDWNKLPQDFIREIPPLKELKKLLNR